jgi:hypothetical protein
MNLMPIKNVRDIVKADDVVKIIKQSGGRLICDLGINVENMLYIY